jgi:ethanolamine utilization protein EutA (predicted chaperonin)
LRTRLINGLQLARPEARIRATVIGAAQYTVQVSGSTIFVSPLESLPLRNVPVIAPALPLDDDKIEPGAVATAIRSALKRRELDSGDSAVAVFLPWRGSATFQRLDDLCRGILSGLAPILAHGHPIVLVGDSDVGGLIGIHFCEEMKVATPIVSIDGLELKDFDYIDIGAILDASGAVAVVIKSLVFPASAGVGRGWQSAPSVAAAAP